MSDILVHTEAGVMTVTFNRLDKKNSITSAMYGELADALARAEQDGDVRAVLIQGDATIFSAGNDIGDFLNQPPSTEESPVFRFLRGIASFPKPIVAAVCGPAVGIGTTMLFHCDLVYAGDNAAFSMPFVNLGLCPEAASSLLVPEGLTAGTWAKLTGIERFVLRMLDMETTGAQKLDNYQNFAKAFRVEDYGRVMGDMRPNHARLKRASEYTSRELTDATEIGAARLGRLIIALQQLRKDTEPQVIVDQLRAEMADFLEVRLLLVDMLTFIERKSPEPEARNAAEVLGSRLKNLRFGD